MPKAPKKELDKNDLWKRENTRLIQIRIANSSGIPDALDRMTEEKGISATQYMREALLDKLAADGYIKLEVVEIKRPVKVEE